MNEVTTPKHQPEYYTGMAERAKKYDIELPTIDMSVNRYALRRVLRDVVNKMCDEHFPLTKKAGLVNRILIDNHIIDRLYDREFPIDEFLQILAKLGNKCEAEILKLVEDKANGVHETVRICCHGYGNLMVGVTLHPYFGHSKETGKEYEQNSYHIVVRTCYAERNIGIRERTNEVHRIWTRGQPKWYRDLQFKKAKMEKERHEHLSNLKAD